MIRTLILLGGLAIVLAPAGARANARTAPGSLSCSGVSRRRCERIGSAAARGDATASKSRWIAARLPEGAVAPFHPAPTPASRAAPASAPGNFAPGESTAQARHVVAWTLLAAPLAAYALSPVIDHRLHHEGSGIWTRKYQLDFEHLVMLTEIGGALWYGGESRIGKTFWRSLDSSLYTGVTVLAMKYAFSRARPYQSKSPDRWFQGNCCESFPSGEVSFQAGFVTPFIAEYHKDHPWVWALEALPAYDALARMKAQGHWQTDVLAAWAIGTAWGLYAHYEPKPLILSFMPGGIMVGLHVHF